MSKKKVIIAIDPGSHKCGFAVLDNKAKHVIAFDIIVAKGKDATVRIGKIIEGIKKKIKNFSSKYNINLITIERYFPHNRKGATVLCELIGVLKQELRKMKFTNVVNEYTSNMVVSKKNKLQNRKELTKDYIIKMFDIEDNLDYDIYDAIALGVVTIKKKEVYNVSQKNKKNRKRS